MEKQKSSFLKSPKFIVLAAFAFLFLLAYQQGWLSFLTWSRLQENKDNLQLFKENHFFLMSVALIVIYILTVTFSLPGAVILSLASGFLFGRFVGTLYVVVAATAGATFLYILARWFLGDIARSKAKNIMGKIEEGLKKDGFWYILTLRLIPVFPFVGINLGCALLKAPIKQYILATFLGILPGSFIYVSIGNSLRFATDAAEPNFAEIISQPVVWGPIFALVCLSSLPILVKKVKKKI